MSTGGSEGRLTEMSRGTRPIIGNLLFTVGGSLAVLDNASAEYRTPTPLRLISVSARVKTAPVGAALTVDISVQSAAATVSSSIFLSPSSRATIADGAKFSGVTILSSGISNINVPANSTLRMNIKQVGSTTAGSDITAQLDMVQ
jgi:hypothetical protein